MRHFGHLSHDSIETHSYGIHKPTFSHCNIPNRIDKILFGYLKKFWPILEKLNLAQD